MSQNPLASFVTRTRSATFGTTLLVVCVSVLLGCGADEQASLLTSAKQRLDRGEVAAALIDARNAVSTDEKSAAARLMFGKALLANGDFAGAETEIRRAREFGADMNQLMPVEASLMEARRESSALITRFNDVALDDVDAHVSLRLAVARSYRDLGDFDSAAKVLDEVQARRPESVEARILRARLAGGRGDVTAARRMAAELVEASPDVAQVWLLRADTLAQEPAGRADAVTAYRKALELRPRLREAHGNLISLLLDLNDLTAAKAQAAAMRKALPGSALTDFYEALVSYAAGDHPRVRELTQRLLRSGGGSAQVLYMAGMSEMRLGALAQAESLLSRAVAAAPSALETRRELAGLYVRRARPEAALETLKPLLDAGTDDAGTWRYAGQAHALVGNFRPADEAFARAVRLQPEDARTRIAVGRSLIARGQFEQGIRELQSAAEGSTGFIEADLELVSALMRRRRYDDALKAVGALATKRPELALTDQLRGRILQVRGDLAGARLAYESALSRDAGLLAAADSLARLDAAEGRLGEARKRYEAAIKRNPRATSAMLALAELTLREGGSYEEAGEWITKAVRVNSSDAAAWRAAISLHVGVGDLTGALSRARAALAAVPEDPALLALVASTQLATGDTQQATVSAQRVTQLLPRSSDAMIQLAKVYAVSGNLAAARQHAMRALELDPDSTSALRGSIEVELRSQQPARAMAVARTIQKRRPADPLGWQLESEVEAAQGRWADAAVALKVAMAKRESTAVAVQAHRAYSRAGLITEAQHLAQRWLKAHPTDQTFKIHLAEEALASGDWSVAENWFRRSLEADPVNPALLNNLAYVLVKRGDVSALEPALKAARQAPYLAEIFDTLSMAFELTGQLPKAIESQTRVVSLAPQKVAYRMRLVALHLRAGERAKAREELDRIETKEPAPEHAEELRRLRQAVQS